MSRVAEESDIIWMRPERPARGPRPAYSRAQITRAAIKIADAEGLAAASMRRVAAEIGAGAMSLYRYVPNRDDLIDLMIDEVMGEYELPDRPTGDWRADQTLVARQTRALTHRHPWLVDVWPRRALFAPNTLAVAEFTLGSLDGLGLTIDEIMSHIGVILGYAHSVAATELSEEAAMRRVGASSREELMARSGPYVRELLDSGEYPMISRVILYAEQPHMDPDARFEYGLERILDGIAGGLLLPRGE